MYRPPSSGPPPGAQPPPATQLAGPPPLGAVARPPVATLGPPATPGLSPTGPMATSSPRGQLLPPSAPAGPPGPPRAGYAPGGGVPSPSAPYRPSTPRAATGPALVSPSCLLISTSHTNTRLVQCPHLSDQRDQKAHLTPLATSMDTRQRTITAHRGQPEPRDLPDCKDPLDIWHPHRRPL